VLGVAHACGHDAHMAALLGAARIVAERRAELTRSVRLLFQPSEECFPGGAPAMIEAGCLEGVAEVYGLHNAPDLAAGVVVVGRGPVMAACDNVRLTLVGRGCHGATPQLGLDPIAAGARVVREWRELALARIAELRARTGERGAEEPGSGKPESAAPETGAPGAAFAPVVSICTFHAGDKENVYPERAHLSGTVRTLEAAERAAVEGALRELLAGLEAEGYGFELDYEHSYPAVVNHPEAARRVVRLAAAVLGAQRVGPMAASRAWAEDFSYYLLERPGAYFFLGGGSPDPAPGEPLRGAGEPLHSPRHAFDEAALPAGAAVLAALALAP
jgi:hippurate hydrolase